jgi:thiol-disulfide isomerase/thioredoxin
VSEPPEPSASSPERERSPAQTRPEAEPRVPRHTLDPDRAVADAGGPPKTAPAAIDTRPHRWLIGMFGLALLVAFSIYELGKHGIVTPGVAAGKRLHHFVAPLATTGPDRPANPRPRCDPAHPNPVALNVCGRTPLALVFFATGSGACKRQVDTLQAVSRRFPPHQIQFAAIAINAGRSETARLVRTRRWTLPVAFDSEGAIGALYNVDICPIVELAHRGGTVAARLIGEHWLDASALAAQVRRLVSR